MLSTRIVTPPSAWNEIAIDTSAAAISSSAWNEIAIDASSTKLPTSACHNNNVGDKIKEGHVIVELPDVVTEAECDAIRRYGSTRMALGEQSIIVVDQPGLSLDQPGLVRLPTIQAAARAKAIVTPCAQPLSPEIDRLCDDILLRVVALIDEQIPSIGTSLFHDGNNTTSLVQRMTSDQLEYTSREPAVNVYTDGGEFRPHEDGQSLTVLITLSSPGRHFDGGGTAFWSQEGCVEPSLVLKPPAGTVLLFGGSVTHAGVSVEDGERVVFVASFSQIGICKLAAEMSRDMLW